jgi:hypothetical protein
VNSATGDILLIDFTESRELLQTEGKYSLPDLTLADTFLRVAASAVPADCAEERKTAIREVVARIEAEGDTGTIHPQLRALLTRWM